MTPYIEWYNKIVFNGELLEKSSLDDCYIYLPYSYEMWEIIKFYLDSILKNDGVKNVYFPSLIKFEEDVAIRTTSEIPFYSYFSNNTNNLPIKFSQWCNAIRDKITYPIPFLKSREFLWQEGHGVFESEQKADYDALDKITIYMNIYKELLCIPVVLGMKEEEKEEERSYILNTFIPNASKSVNCASSKYLGQKLAKLYNIQFKNKLGKKEYAYQSFWSFSSSALGVAIMMHSDDKGLVIPPKLAPKQIIILTNSAKINEYEYANKLNIKYLYKWRVHIEKKLNLDFKYWEMKGVPIILEINQKDIDEETVLVYRRDTDIKMSVKIFLIEEFLSELFDSICDNLYDNAKNKIAKKTKIIYTKEQFNKEHTSCDGKFLYINVCHFHTCEQQVKKMLNCDTLCLPFTSFMPKIDSEKTTNCVICGNELYTNWMLFAKSIC